MRKYGKILGLSACYVVLWPFLVSLQDYRAFGFGIRHIWLLFAGIVFDLFFLGLPYILLQSPILFVGWAVRKRYTLNRSITAIAFPVVTCLSAFLIAPLHWQLLNRFMGGNDPNCVTALASSCGLNPQLLGEFRIAWLITGFVAGGILALPAYSPRPVADAPSAAKNPKSRSTLPTDLPKERDV